MNCCFGVFLGGHMLGHLQSLFFRFPFIFKRGICFCFSICCHRTEEKWCFKKLISSSKVVLVLSSLSLR